MGIARKTFLFTAALIVFAVVISLGVLYFVLPDYYYRLKSARIREQTDILTQKLKNAQTEEECASLIGDFSVSNNAVVLSFESDDTMIPELSTPFLSLGPKTRLNVIIDGQNPLDAPAIKGFRISDAGQEVVATADRFIASVNQLSIKHSIQNGVMDHILVVGTMQPVGEATDVIISLMPYLLLLDLMIALAAAYLFSKRLTKPILSLSRAASQMREMTPGAKSGIHTRDELGELSANLDLLYKSLCSNIETLQEEKVIIERLEQAKTDFMRAASHELKTPITALNGIVEGMIDNVGVYKNKEKYLAECKNLINRLSGLVSEILDAAAMDGAAGDARLRVVDLDKALEDALTEYQILSDAKSLRMEKEIRPFRAVTDETLVYRTLLNLVSNAVKYTPEGGLICIRLQPRDSGCMLSIGNQCDPIPEEQIERLFEPFFTLSYSRDKKQSGVGLGLYIVKRDLERLQLPFCLKNTQSGVEFSIIFP